LQTSSQSILQASVGSTIFVSGLLFVKNTSAVRETVQWVCC